jgi:hypothetical protein
MDSTETQPAPVLAERNDDKWRREQKAFHRLLPDLLPAYRDQFVAIHEGRVIESGPEKLDVARRAYARFGYLPIFVSRVAETPSAPIRIPSPRRFGGPPT